MTGTVAFVCPPPPVLRKRKKDQEFKVILSLNHSSLGHGRKGAYQANLAPRVQFQEPRKKVGGKKLTPELSCDLHMC